MISWPWSLRALKFGAVTRPPLKGAPWFCSPDHVLLVSELVTIPILDEHANAASDHCHPPCIHRWSVSLPTHT